MKHYDNLTKRSISYFIDTYSDFSPITCDISKQAQKAAYQLIKDIYQKLYDEPDILCAKHNPDDAYELGEILKDKPGLDANIRKNIVKTEKIIVSLYDACLIGTYCKDHLSITCDKISDMTSLKKLNKLGIPLQKHDDMMLLNITSETYDALNLLANISKQNYDNATYKNSAWTLFSRGVFNTSIGYNKSVFKRLCCDNGHALDSLFTYFEKNGYTRIENREHASHISKITLDYVKFYNMKDKKLAASWNVKTHAGIELGYDELKSDRFFLGLRIPYFNTLLDSYMTMSQELKDFIKDKTKKCDACRYCVQTDKTGKKPLAAVLVDDAKLCPFFPGYMYRFTEVNDELVNKIIQMLQFIDLIADK